MVIGFYTAIAHVIPQLESEVPQALDLSAGATPEALVAAGERIYNGAGGCVACHGLGTRAPNLLTDHAGQGAIGARCGTREKDCKTYLHESMTSPNGFVVPGFEPIMPDMRRQLTEDQIWAVIAFLQSQGGEVTVTAADLPRAPAAGAQANAGPAPSATLDPMALITEKGCIACHTIGGQGGALGPPFEGMGRRINADRIRRGILQPAADTAKGYEKFAGTMPPNFGTQLSAAQLEALVTFLAGRR
jgi:mono/diheme cytochrome c family protein